MKLYILLSCYISLCNLFSTHSVAGILIDAEEWEEDIHMIKNRFLQVEKWHVQRSWVKGIVYS